MTQTLASTPAADGFWMPAEFERHALHEHVTRKRREFNGRLDVRWLDFTARPIHVVEPDGRVVLEGATEAMDKVLGHIPAVGEEDTGKGGANGLRML